MSVYRSGKAGGKQWRGEFTHPVTKERVRAPRRFYTKAEGLEWEREERDKIRASGGEYRPTKLTVGEFVDQVWRPQRNVSRSTSDRDRALLRRIEPLRSAKLGALKRSEINAWIKQLEATETPHVVGKTVELLSTILQLAVEDGMRTTNPARGAKVKQPPPHDDRVLTDDEVDLIARNIKRPEDQLLVWTLAYTGLRFGEAAALKQEYVDLRAKLIRVRWTLDKRTGDLKELKGSNDAYRTVPIPSWLAERLDLGVPRGRIFVFQALRGGLIRYDNWRKRTWEPALVSARLQEPRPTIHDLRHFYGTKLGAAGVGEGNIAALMGHSAMSRITRRYVQPTESRLEQARQVMGG